MADPSDGGRTGHRTRRRDPAAAPARAPDGVRPVVPDLEVRVLDGPVPALFVRNASSSTLEVPGLDDEPFLRIGPDGVWANKRSPTWYLAGAQTIFEVPPEADARAEPDYERVSGQPVWTWLEYRARIPDDDQMYDLGADARTVIRWTTPASLDGRPLEIEGVVRWEPPPGRDRTAGGPSPLLLAAVLGGLVAVVLLGLRRRR